MKKVICLFTICVLSLVLGGCSNKYVGYWCKYNETSTIVVLLNDNVTEEQKQIIENKINGFENVETVNYYSKDDYLKELGEDENSDIEIYNTYVILFDSVDYIGTYIEELKALGGVMEATQSNAKTNISLYEIKKFGKYTFTDSDEAEEGDLEKGKYKIKNGVITFTPSNKDKQTTMLYIKSNHLCGDVNCTQIYAESNSTCSSQTSEE